MSRAVEPRLLRARRRRRRTPLERSGRVPDHPLAGGAHRARPRDKRTTVLHRPARRRRSAAVPCHWVSTMTDRMPCRTTSAIHASDVGTRFGRVVAAAAPVHRVCPQRSLADCEPPRYRPCQPRKRVTRVKGGRHLVAKPAFDRMHLRLVSTASRRIRWSCAILVNHSCCASVSTARG